MTGAPKRVLIVHSRVGGGHLSAARALAEAFEADGRATTSLADVYLDGGRGPVRLFPAAYAMLARHHPWLWSMIYGGSARLRPAPMLLEPFLEPGLRRLMDRARPDLVVSVLPVVNGMLVEAAASVGAGVEVVLTDWHAIHPAWVARGVRRYLTPTVSAADECIRLGARPDQVDVIGIPVRRAFWEPEPRVPGARAGFSILAMVGAEGSPRALQNIARLAQLELDGTARLLVVCGRNAELRRRVQRMPARLQVSALGFVDSIADLMRSADVLVTKAGGLTLAEAFCCRAPVVVHDVLPGQEAGNLAYVLSRQAVLYAPHPASLARTVLGVYRDPAGRAALAERGARLARPDAARRIAAGMLTRLGA